MVKREPSNYAVTRQQRRYIARLKATEKQREEVRENRASFEQLLPPTDNGRVLSHPEKSQKLFKHSYFQNKYGQERVPSTFALNWKEYYQEGVQ